MYYIVDRAVGGCDPAVVHLPLSPQLCRFSEYKANTVQAVQATRRSLYFSLPLQRETRKPLRSPALPPSDESSTVVQAWQSGRRRPPSPAPPPPSADLHQLLQHQHQKHQASPVFASKALPTRRQRGEKHQKHHRLTSSFTKFDSFLGMFAPLIFLKQFIAVEFYRWFVSLEDYREENSV